MGWLQAHEGLILLGFNPEGSSYPAIKLPICSEGSALQSAVLLIALALPLAGKDQQEPP